MSLSISNSSAGISGRPVGARFLLLWATCVVAMLLAIGVFNAWIDPLGRLGRNTLGIYHSAEFEYKVTRLPYAIFDGVLIGSSKIANIDPEWISQKKLFNAAFSGALPEEMFLFLHANRENLKKKFIVIGFDFFMFNERTKSKRGAELISPSGTDILGYLLSMRSSYFSLQTLLKFARGERAKIKVNGARYINDLIEKDQSLIAPDYGEKIPTILRSLYGQYDFSYRRVSRMRELRQLLERHGITYKVILNPQNELLIAALESAGLRGAFDTYRTELRSVFPNLIDLSQSELSAPEHFFHQSPFYFRPAVMRDMVVRALLAIDDSREGLPAEGKR